MLCTLVEHKSYEKARDAIEADVRRADDLLIAVTWQIGRSPTSCPESLGSPFRVAASWTPSGDVVVVWFTYDEAHGKAHLWHVERFGVSEDDI